MTMIRSETSADAASVYAVNQRAFRGRTAEPNLVEAIRSSGAYIPELSLVAEENGQVVGHILFSRIYIETGNGPATPGWPSNWSPARWLGCAERSSTPRRLMRFRKMRGGGFLGRG